MKTDCAHLLQAAISLRHYDTSTMCSFGAQNSLFPSAQNTASPWAEGKPGERHVPSALWKLYLCKEGAASFAEKYDSFLMNCLTKCTPSRDGRLGFNWLCLTKPKTLNSIPQNLGHWVLVLRWIIENTVSSMHLLSLVNARCKYFGKVLDEIHWCSWILS